MKLEPTDRAAYSFHHPAGFGTALLGLRGIPAMIANQQTLLVYAGEKLFMYDPDLRDRLLALTTPTLILWGESDRIVTPKCGKQFSGIIPSAQFKLIPQAGHFPQIEQLEEVLQNIEDFPKQI